MSAHDDAPAGELVNVHVGPDWDTPRGARVRAYLDEFAASIADAADAVAGVPDAVLLTGDIGSVGDVLGLAGADLVAGAREGGHAYCTCAAGLSWELLRRLLDASGSARLIEALVATHGARGDGRALLVCVGGAWTCLAVAYAEGRGAVAKGGDA